MHGTVMECIRLGIIGIGNMGSAHAMQIFQNKIEGMILATVCDTDTERLAWAAQSFGDTVCRYQDYRELLEEKCVDAVLIATPHRLHPQIATEAFEAGLHVLTEKPSGIDVTSVRKMNEAAAKSGRVFGIMFNQRTNPLFQDLRELLLEKRLGEIKRFVWIVNNWYRTQHYYDSGEWRATWNGEGGGVLLNQCPHNLDIWQWMMGMPKRLRAFCRVGQYHDISVEDDVTIYAEYENGANACFITSTGEYPGTNRMEISGTKGKAVLEDGVLKLYLLEKDERDICRMSKEGMPAEHVEKLEIIPERQDTGHLGILQNFANAILYGEALLAPGVEGIYELTISNAAYLSDWREDWVEIPFEEEVFLEELSIKQKEECTREGIYTGITPRKDSEASDGTYSERWKVRW